MVVLVPSLVFILLPNHLESDRPRGSRKVLGWMCTVGWFGAIVDSFLGTAELTRRAGWPWMLLAAATTIYLILPLQKARNTSSKP
jgi:hypothetical protein